MGWKWMNFKTSSNLETLWLWLKECLYATLGSLTLYGKKAHLIFFNPFIYLTRFINSPIRLFSIHLLIIYYESGTVLSTADTMMHEIETLPREFQSSPGKPDAEQQNAHPGLKCYITRLNRVLWEHTVWFLCVAGQEHPSKVEWWWHVL